MIKRESGDEHNDDADNYDDVITMNTIMSKVPRPSRFRVRSQTLLGRHKTARWAFVNVDHKVKIVCDALSPKYAMDGVTCQKTSDFTGLPRHQTQAGTPSRVKKWIEMWQHSLVSQ
jgi:hypothetical protein